MNNNIQKLKLSDIVIDRSIQPRANGLDEDHVLDLVAAYDRGDPVPPPVVWKIGDTLKASQGYHRLEAAIRRGVTELVCEVRVGTEIECAIDALTSNREHMGLKRTNADKRRAVDRLLELCPGWSANRIADAAGVGTPLVSERKELRCKNLTPEQAREVKGKDGKTYTVKPKAPKGQPTTGTSGTTAPADKPASETKSASDDPPVAPAATEPPAPAGPSAASTATVPPSPPLAPAPPPRMSEPALQPAVPPPPPPAPLPPAIPAGRKVCPHCGGCGHVPTPALLHTAAGMPPIPAALDTPAFREVWEEWLCERKARKKPVTDRAARLQLTSLESLPVGQAIECIQKSIQSGWAGIFPEQFTHGHRTTGSRSGRDRNPSRVDGAPGDFDNLGGPDFVCE